MKLLIIEDNRQLAKSIKAFLGRSFVTDIALTGQEGIEKALNASYTLIILDLQLPDLSGSDVCKALRRSGNETPILILTGDASTDSCVRLLQAGADDYLTKPFKAEELHARLQALSRRSSFAYSPDIITIRDLTLDITRRSVRRGTTDIPLRRKEFDILHYLIQNRGRAVTREMILNNVWEAGKDRWNNTVDVHIKHLRDKVDRPFKTSMIKTAYGIGYMVDDAVM